MQDKVRAFAIQVKDVVIARHKVTANLNNLMRFPSARCRASILRQDRRPLAADSVLTAQPSGSERRPRREFHEEPPRPLTERLALYVIYSRP